MTYFNIQLSNKKLNMDVAMNAKDCVKDILNFAISPINESYHLDQEEKSAIAAACFEEDKREEAAEALNLGDTNSDVICKLLSFLKNDTSENRDDLCESIKSSFIKYYQDRIDENLYEVLTDRLNSLLEEKDLNSSNDNMDRFMNL